MTRFVISRMTRSCGPRTITTGHVRGGLLPSLRSLIWSKESEDGTESKRNYTLRSPSVVIPAEAGMQDMDTCLRRYNGGDDFRIVAYVIAFI